MRVLTKIDGLYQVDEILAFGPIENGKVTLYTAEYLLDMEISGVGLMEHENIARELLRNGYADLSRFSVKNVEDDEDTEEDYKY